jgi:hypothetical protein
MEAHKYDRRGSSLEGRLAENLFEEVCKIHKQKYVNASLKEDCAGIDGYLNGRKLDVKARKKRIPANSTWIELARANGRISSGWAFANKLIAQLMLYEEAKFITKAQFGLYHTEDLKDMLSKIIKDNIVAKKGELYKIYTRPAEEKGELHRGIMTVLKYADIEKLPSFVPMEVPNSLLGPVKIEYGYLGIKC